MAEFFSMGGYATFVWPAYGLTVVVMAVVLVASLRGLKDTQAKFERLTDEMGEIPDDGETTR